MSSSIGAPQVHLYAEQLINIRSVTVFATLHSNDTLATARVATDGLTFTLIQGGNDSSITLPARVDVGQNSLSSTPSANSNEKIFRLPPDTRQADVPCSVEADNSIPWSAQSLAASQAVRCGICGHDVLIVDSITKWFDLPSENWAEMMDFWHCHKPPPASQSTPSTDHAASENDVSQKGYAAANRFQARQGRAYVGAFHLLVSPQNCSAQNVYGTERPDIHCNACCAVIGAIDDRTDSWKLHKRALAVNLKHSTAPAYYPAEKWVAAQLLSSIENQAVRKFWFRHNSTDSKDILVWIFTPDLWYNSSQCLRDQAYVSGAKGPKRAMKVLWKSVADTEKANLGTTAMVEETILAEDLLAQLESALLKNQILLPESARKYKGWHVTLLHRFAPGDV